MKVYVYKEYNDGLAYGEEIIRVYADKESACAHLREMAEEIFKCSMDELAEKCSDMDTVTDTYVSVMWGDSAIYLCVEENDLIEETKGPELGNLLFGNYSGGNHLDRERYEKIMLKFLESNDFDNYGYYNGSLQETECGGYANDVFEIRPYYWGIEEGMLEKPNFLYKKTGLEIRWYKYPLRDAYSNREITENELRSILNDCAISMQKGEAHA